MNNQEIVAETITFEEVTEKNLPDFCTIESAMMSEFSCVNPDTKEYFSNATKAFKNFNATFNSISFVADGIYLTSRSSGFTHKVTTKQLVALQLSNVTALNTDHILSGGANSHFRSKSASIGITVVAKVKEVEEEELTELILLALAYKRAKDLAIEKIETDFKTLDIVNLESKVKVDSKYLGVTLDLTLYFVLKEQNKYRAKTDSILAIIYRVIPNFSCTKEVFEDFFYINSSQFNLENKEIINKTLVIAGFVPKWERSQNVSICLLSEKVSK